MSVRTGSFRYRQRLDLSQSVRGGANGAWPRTRQRWGWARKGQFGECPAGRRSRSPGTAEINPGLALDLGGLPARMISARDLDSRENRDRAQIATGAGRAPRSKAS
eukprot:scaffold73804_cov96-Phaeocystis_antarctica.AAC.1